MTVVCTLKPLPRPVWRVGQDVLVDIKRGNKVTLCEAVISGVCGDMAYVRIPSRLVRINGRNVGQREHKWIQDWEWVTLDRLYEPPQ